MASCRLPFVVPFVVSLRERRFRRRDDRIRRRSGPGSGPFPSGRGCRRRRPVFPSGTRSGSGRSGAPTRWVWPGQPKVAGSVAPQRMTAGVSTSRAAWTKRLSDRDDRVKPGDERYRLPHRGDAQEAPGAPHVAVAPAVPPGRRRCPRPRAASPAPPSVGGHVLAGRERPGADQDVSYRKTGC